MNSSLISDSIMPLSEKFVKKYMRQAKLVGEDQNPCYSRHIGVLLVRVYDDGGSRILSTGYNGPPRNTPHCDSREYLKDIVWPQLTEKEKDECLTAEDYNFDENGCSLDEHLKHCFLAKYSNCGQCPRRIIKAKSGKRPEICSCEHAERNAIYNATDDLNGAWAFCWCGVSCWDCTKALINAGIKRCFFISNNEPDYSFGSRWLYNKANIRLFIKTPEYYLF